jgi:cytochrome b
MRVWDLPVRLFHWLLVVLVATSYVTAKFGWMKLHFYSGYSILTLLLFRVIWGFVGSDTARFARFLTSPVSALKHLAHLPAREPDNQIGHNEAGGWMVLIMLALLLFQAGSGLFSTDDVAADGPLSEMIGTEASERITTLHDYNFDLILIAIGVHILAILTYAVLKRHDLVRPMITGKKRLPAATRPPRMASPVLALLVFLCAAGLVALVANH